jgi:hypothetical protein
MNDGPEAVVALYDSGLSMRQVGDRLDMDRKEVSRRLREAGREARARTSLVRARQCSTWKGGRIISEQGYVLLRIPEHPRADVRGYVREHVLIAERSLGRPLPPEAVVHHLGGKTENHRIVICENRSYHFEIHRRMRVRDAGGDPRRDRMCSNCGPVPVENFGGHRHRCRPCHAREERDRWRRKRGLA